MLKLENLRPGEKVLMVLKRHWIVYVILSIYTALSVFITLFLLVGVSSHPDFYLIVYIILIIFWMTFSLFLYVEWLNHELDMFIITDNRIIGIEQHSFLNRTVTECNLGQVQEVNSKTKGIFENLLNFGTIFIQTAGNSTNLKMDFAPDSLVKAGLILNIVDDYRDRKHIEPAKKEENLEI